MKLDRNICLMVLLGFILLYCCLGTTTLEGLSTAESVAAAGQNEAQKMKQEESNRNGMNGTQNDIDAVNRERQKGHPKGIKENWINTRDWLGGSKDGILDKAKEVQNEGIEEADKMRQEEAIRDNRDGLGCPPGYHKNRDNVCALKPDNYNNSCDKGYVWNETTQKCQRALGPGGQHKPDHGCPKGMHWDHKEKKCIHSKKDHCPDGMHWDHDEKKCVHHKKDHCPKGMHWDHKEKKCTHSKKDHCPDGMHWSNKKNKCHKMHDDSSSDSDSDSDSWDLSKFWGGNKHRKHHGRHHHRGHHGQQVGTYPAGAEVRASQIPPGQEDMYILRSKIVPPVCPACPPVLACPSKAKCAPCPRPPAIQPCPPCARCPEPNFDCKKVPNYKNPSLIPGDLPRPILNDFSQFT